LICGCGQCVVGRTEDAAGNSPEEAWEVGTEEAENHAVDQSGPKADSNLLRNRNEGTQVPRGQGSASHTANRRSNREPKCRGAERLANAEALSLRRLDDQ
jgi:hypothetical protein